MVQDCRAGEDPNSVCPPPAQSPARDSFRCRSGVVLTLLQILLATRLQTWTLMPALPNAHADSLGVGVLTNLQFEDEGAARPGKATASAPQQASQTVRMLCSLTSDPQLVGLHGFRSSLNCILSVTSFICKEHLLYVSVYLSLTLPYFILTLWSFLVTNMNHF